MLAYAILALVAGGGACSTYLYENRACVTARLAAGACVGLTAFALIGFILSLLLGFTALSLTLAVAALAAPLLLLLRDDVRSALQVEWLAAVSVVRGALAGRERATLAAFLAFVALSVPVALLFSRALYQTPDGVYTGIYTNRNDLPLHIAIIEGFVRGENFPPEHPEFAGARLTYPFLVDFLPAQLMQVGASMTEAVTVQNLMLSLALIALLYRWALILTRDRVASVLTPLLILLGSGVGWVVMLYDARASEHGFLTFLFNLPHDYTINTRNLRWGNVATTMLVSQRSFLLGLSLFTVISGLWWQAIAAEQRRDSKSSDDEANRRLRLMLGAGALAGLLPLAHTHTFMVTMGMGAWLALLFRQWRAWAGFFVVASLLAAPQLWWASQGSMVQTSSFIGWHFGWTKESEGIVWFWFKNTGLFIPLLAAALLARGRWRLVPRNLLWFYLPFLLCFIVPQLVRLAPRITANIKVLVYWYVMSAPLVALLLARLYRAGWAPRVVAAGLVTSLILAGALDVWRVLSGASAVRVFDAAEVEFALLIQRTTAPRARILHAPSRNHPVFLTGHASLVGNPLHVGSHGFDYKGREQDIRRIYEGGSDAVQLLQRYGIEYAVVGPEERERFRVDDGFFTHYPVVAEAGGFRLYRMKPMRHTMHDHSSPITAPE